MDQSSRATRGARPASSSLAVRVAIRVGHDRNTRTSPSAVSLSLSPSFSGVANRVFVTSHAGRQSPRGQSQPQTHRPARRMLSCRKTDAKGTLSVGSRTAHPFRVESHVLLATQENLLSLDSNRRRDILKKMTKKYNWKASNSDTRYRNESEETSLAKRKVSPSPFRWRLCAHDSHCRPGWSRVLEAASRARDFVIQQVSGARGGDGGGEKEL